MSERTPLQVARAHCADNGLSILDDFISLLQLPNVTGSRSDLRINAEELCRRFHQRGAVMEVVELDDAAPVVIGELRSEAPTATIGVYVHYDGQPVAPQHWTYPPFSATVLDGPLHDGGRVIDLSNSQEHIHPEWRIYARSASDDKTHFSAILAALDALNGGGVEPKVDLVFLFEGEEESGSPNLSRYMEQLAPRLQADAWLLCDGPVHQNRQPLVAFGARGYSGFDLTFYGPERELHSGHYGNWVPNPALDLASFLATCKGSDAMVAIDGFYDDTLPMTDTDRAAIASLPRVEELLQEQLGFGGAEVDGPSLGERLMLPSFNVRGLASASVGEDARNVIPASATASVDMRLAAGDDPETMLDRVESHLRRSGYTVLDREPTSEERRTHRRLARLDRDVNYRAARLPLDSPFSRILLDICDRASDEEVVALPTFGGSVPLHLFEDLLDAPVAILPIANHDNNQHGHDENVRVGNLWYGIALWATLLTGDFGALHVG